MAKSIRPPKTETDPLDALQKALEQESASPARDWLLRLLTAGERASGKVQQQGQVCANPRKLR